jgi:CBS domain containing-hemolysin-like protein
VVLSAAITKLLLRKEPELTVSREEISALADIGAEEGVFGEREHKILQNILQLRKLKVSQILTPRVVTVSVNQDMTLKEFYEDGSLKQFSRIPIFKNDKDEITGYVFRQEVLEMLAEDEFEMQLKHLRREIVTIPYSSTLFAAWDELLSHKEHIALVVDEYGGVDGIVTMEDIIETLLGLEIVDERDEITDMQKFAIESWKKRRKGLH